MIKKMLGRKTTSRSSLCATLENNHLIAQFIAKSLQPFSVLNNAWVFQVFISLHQVPVTGSRRICGCSVSKAPPTCFVSNTSSVCQYRKWPQRTTQRSASNYRMQSKTLLFCQFLRHVTDTINSATILPILITQHIF